MVNGTIADGLQPRLKRADVMPEIMSTGKENDLGTARKEGKQDIPLQGLMGEDESVSGTLVEECAAISRTPNDEDKSTIVSAASGSLENRSLSAQDMLHQATSNKENDSCRKSIRRSVNGSANLENQNIISKIGSESIPVDHTSPSHAKADFRPNDSTEDRQPSPVSHDIDLKDAPSDLHNLGIWVARSINVYADKSPISATSEPRQKDSSPRPGQDIETIDALDNVEGVRMTRGKEKKRLQQLRGKGPAIGMSLSFL